MIANDWYIITRAIEEGLEYGWQRAHKHVEKPSKDELLTAMINAITNAICEVYTFNIREIEDE